MTKPITLLHALTATLFPLTQAKACTEGLNYRGYNLLKKGTANTQRDRQRTQSRPDSRHKDVDKQRSLFLFQLRQRRRLMDPLVRCTYHGERHVCGRWEREGQRLLHVTM
ncbi:uncharacterized protein THITE_116456 [Thermothielavioides terrestris NRRL 8126]|uniref:Secreted protein n=2 Tax=Thermothielavioides terrestris TaxID=2587410 RepID=G2RGY2_THETT|nr:uncharacterized protein THITE_116456 [Thermothielavioides terrestris NRRL 8126]AEO71111.1 hypothetical protein THITE_116456 [Thermothielavioides terrestris NRRL 8126]